MFITNCMNQSWQWLISIEVVSQIHKISCFLELFFAFIHSPLCLCLIVTRLMVYIINDLNKLIEFVFLKLIASNNLGVMMLPDWYKYHYWLSLTLLIFARVCVSCVFDYSGTFINTITKVPHFFCYSCVFHW